MPRWYVIWCLECTPPGENGLPKAGDEIPFPSAAERGKWAAEHTAGTGHNSWWVLDVPRDGGAT